MISSIIHFHTDISCGCFRIIRSQLERSVEDYFLYHHSFNWLGEKNGALRRRIYMEPFLKTDSRKEQHQRYKLK